MNIETSTITIGSILVIIAFTITIITQYRSYKQRIMEAAEKEVRLTESNESLKKDVDRIEREFISFKAEVRAEIKEIDGHLGRKLDQFDLKLDLIKNLIIEKLAK